MTEHAFTRSVNDRLRKRGVYALKLNVRFSGGIPDAWYSAGTADIWIEFKYIPRTPKRSYDPTKLLSSQQRTWLNDRQKEGRNVAVVVGHPAGGYILESGTWNDPQLNPVSLSREQIVDWIFNKVAA